MASGRTSDMTTGDSLRKILLFALPLFIGTMFQQVYNLVDTVIAGHILGDSAFAVMLTLNVGITALLTAKPFRCSENYCGFWIRRKTFSRRPMSIFS